MKIGIVTYTHCYNQGADLQAYALTAILRGWGHSPEVIWFDRVSVGRLQRKKILRRALVGRIRQNAWTGLFEIFRVAFGVFAARFVKKKRVTRRLFANVELPLTSFGMRPYRIQSRWMSRSYRRRRDMIVILLEAIRFGTGG